MSQQNPSRTNAQQAKSSSSSREKSSSSLEANKSFHKTVQQGDTIITKETFVIKKDSGITVDDVIAHSSKSNTASKRKPSKSKTKVVPAPPPQPPLPPFILEQLLRNSTQKPEVKRPPKKETHTDVVIKDWGKHPLLVDTEPPWSVRNRMYTNALKHAAYQQAVPFASVNPSSNQVNNNPAVASLPAIEAIGAPVPEPFPTPTAVQNSPPSQVYERLQVLPPLDQRPVVVLNQSPVPIYIDRPEMALPVPSTTPTFVYGQVTPDGVFLPVPDYQQYPP